MLIIGHRGARALEPENTLRSIEKAISLGVDMVEIDIHRHEDELIVIHDEVLDRTTNGSGFIQDYSYDALRRLDAGKGESIPSLSEVLECVRGRVRLNIEIKGKDTVDLLYQFIKNEEGILVSSYDYLQLKAYRLLDNQVDIGVLGREPFALAKAVNACAVNPSLAGISSDYMRQAREGGYAVYCHTVVNNEDWDLVRTYGVDGCFVDDPSRFNSIGLLNG